MPMRVALSAYAGPMPRRVVPIWSLPRRRSRAPSSATCHGMIRCALPETKTSPAVCVPPRLEVVELGDQHRGVDDAPCADGARLPLDDPRRDGTDLVDLVADDDRVSRVGTALIAADEVGLSGKQVDDLALALVAPLRADDHSRRHVPQCCRRGRRTTRVWSATTERPPAMRTPPSPAPPRSRPGLRDRRSWPASCTPRRPRFAASCRGGSSPTGSSAGGRRRRPS